MCPSNGPIARPGTRYLGRLIARHAGTCGVPAASVTRCPCGTAAMSDSSPLKGKSVKTVIFLVVLSAAAWWGLSHPVDISGPVQDVCDQYVCTDRG